MFYSSAVVISGAARRQSESGAIILACPSALPERVRTPSVKCPKPTSVGPRSSSSWKSGTRHGFSRSTQLPPRASHPCARHTRRVQIHGSRVGRATQDLGWRDPWSLVTTRCGELQRWHLTPPPGGRPKGRFAPFAPPLMSNVRPQKAMPLLLHVTSIPPGEAPLWVREKWVGLSLPLAQRKSSPVSVLTSGVLSGPKTFLATFVRIHDRPPGAATRLRGRDAPCDGRPVCAQSRSARLVAREHASCHATQALLRLSQ